jgi:hypothetical protein
MTCLFLCGVSALFLQLPVSVQTCMLFLHGTDGSDGTLCKSRKNIVFHVTVTSWSCDMFCKRRGTCIKTRITFTNCVVRYRYLFWIDITVIRFYINMGSSSYQYFCCVLFLLVISLKETSGYFHLKAHFPRQPLSTTHGAAKKSECKFCTYETKYFDQKVSHYDDSRVTEDCL